MSDTPVTLYKIDLNADDCPSCLHPWKSHDPEDGWCDHYPGADHCGLLREVRKLEPVGEFVSRPWCAEHGAEGIGDDLAFCWHGCYLLGDPAVGTSECEMIDVLVQVIPDDPKEKK